MARPTNGQAERLEHAETTCLRLDGANKALSRLQVRLGQLRRRVGPKDLVDYALGDLAEAGSYIAEVWQSHAEDREEIVKEVMGNGS